MNNTFLLFYSPKSRNQTSRWVPPSSVNSPLLLRILLRSAGIFRYIKSYTCYTAVFCKISIRRSKYCLEFSISWERLKISGEPFHSCSIFESYLINSLWSSYISRKEEGTSANILCNSYLACPKFKCNRASVSTSLSN